MSDDDVAKRARLLYEAAERAGWKDAPAIVERIRGLQRGLPAEDQLSVILHWLGRCKLVHKLDQAQYPSASRRQFRVPDLLAVFEHGSQDIPVLIEVKASKTSRLKWSRSYLQALQAYSQLVGIPLLVAWKFATLWCLFEPQHFKQATTGFHANFLEVMPHSLMSQLAGDFSFALRPGVGLHLRIRKERPDGAKGWYGRVERAYITDGEGRKRGSAPGLLPLLACFPNYAEQKETRTRFLQSYVVPDGNPAEFAHRCLGYLIAVFGGRTKPMTWRGYIDGAVLPEVTANFHDTISALGPSYVKHIYRIKPQEPASFLRTAG